MSGGAADPSMEDILASIRRILDEDQSPPEETSQAAAPPSESDELLLDETMMLDEPSPPARKITPLEAPPMTSMPAEPDDSADFYAALAALRPAEPPPIEAPPEHPPEHADDNAGLMAPHAAAETTSSMSSFVRAVASERTSQIHAGGPTIEDVVREELRPLLKAWLDTHLPPLVERVVRAEIERVANRAVP